MSLAPLMAATELLACPYLHVTVTVPQELHDVLRANQRDGIDRGQDADAATRAGRTLGGGQHGFCSLQLHVPEHRHRGCIMPTKFLRISER